MPIFKTGDGTEDTVLFVTLPLVTPDWFRIAVMGALREMTIESNWFVEGDALAAFARDKAVEMINGIEFSEVNPLPINKPYVGEIRMFAFTATPDGWLACEGQDLLQVNYPDLFAVIGTDFGSTNFSTNFSLPDLRHRFPVGQDIYTDSPYDLADTGGSETVTLTEAQIPAHNHAQIGFATGATTPVQNIGGARTGSSTTLNNTGLKGGGEAHENRPPFLALVFAIYAGVE